MKLRLLPILLLTALAPAVMADSVSDFLLLRKANKIVGVTGADALNSFVGQRVVEIKGTLKGVIRVGEDSAIVVQSADQSSLTINAASLPDWLTGNEVDLRLIISVTRIEEYAPLELRLLGLVSEPSIKPFDPKSIAPKPTKATNPKASTPRAPLTGRIGRGGTKLESRGGSPSRVVSKNAAVPVYAEFIAKNNKRLSDQECWDIASAVIEFSLQNSLDPRLVMAIIVQESGFNPNATSRAGAMGLMQLMPGTAAGLGVGDAYDITQNVFGAVKLLRSHLDKYYRQTGDWEKALVLSLAAYNAGPGAVRKYDGVPPYKETQGYVRKVVAIYNRLTGR